MRNLIERFKNEGTLTSKIVFGLACLLFLAVIIFFIIEVVTNGWDVGVPDFTGSVAAIETAMVNIGGIV